MRAFFLLVFIFVSSPAFADDPVRFGGQGELYIPMPLQNATADGDRLRIRSLELTGQSKLDDVAPGLLAKVTIGGDDSVGDLTINLREAFVDASLGRFDLRVGKFYLPVGLLNQTRRSAWHMISAPRAISLFFTDNGVVDTGADLTYTEDHFEIRAGGANGYRFDSSVTNTGQKPLTPTHFARPAVFFSLTPDSRLTLAGNYLGRVADDGTSMRLAGLDVSLTPLVSDAWGWQGQLEFYHRYVKPSVLAISEEIGGYVFGEKGFGESSLVGVRFDFYKIPSLRFANGDDRKNLTLALSPVYTYRGREHFKAQVAYTILREERDGDATRVEQAIEFRLVTEFGDIPTFRTPKRDDRSSL